MSNLCKPDDELKTDTCPSCLEKHSLHRCQRCKLITCLHCGKEFDLSYFLKKLRTELHAMFDDSELRTSIDRVFEDTLLTQGDGL